MPGESRLTEVVGQIPPGTTVFVLELRNERGSGCSFDGWGLAHGFKPLLTTISIHKFRCIYIYIYMYIDMYVVCIGNCGYISTYIWKCTSKR